MFTQEVTDKKGQVKQVFADTEEALAAAVASVEAQDEPKTFDINEPVEQGSDLVLNTEEGAVLAASDEVPTVDEPVDEAPQE